MRCWRYSWSLLRHIHLRAHVPKELRAVRPRKNATHVQHAHTCEAPGVHTLTSTTQAPCDTTQVPEGLPGCIQTCNHAKIQ